MANGECIGEADDWFNSYCTKQNKISELQETVVGEADDWFNHSSSTSLSFVTVTLAVPVNKCVRGAEGVEGVRVNSRRIKIALSA